jgi:hypothetical protein
MLGADDLSFIDDLRVYCRSAEARENPWTCEVLSVGDQFMAVPALSFVGQNLHWTLGSLTGWRRAALEAEFQKNGTITIRITYDSLATEDLTIGLTGVRAAASARQALRVATTTTRMLTELVWRVPERQLRLVPERGQMYLTPEHDASQRVAEVVLQVDGSLAIHGLQGFKPFAHDEALTLEVGHPETGPMFSAPLVLAGADRESGQRAQAAE